MAQSQNSTVEFTVKATFLQGLATYGDVMVGNRAFEFYNERNPEDFIQIPWGEIDRIEAEVIGRTIVRFAIFTKKDGHFAFSTRDNGATLRALRAHVPEERMLRSLGFFDVIRLGLRRLLHLGRRP